MVLELEVDMGPMVYKVTEQRQRLQKTWQQHGYDSAYVPPGCGMVGSDMTEVCVKEPRCGRRSFYLRDAGLRTVSVVLVLVVGGGDQFVGQNKK